MKFKRRERNGFAARLHRADLAVFRRVAATEILWVDKVLVPLTKAANYSRLWMALSAALALLSGRRGRRAAMRGMVSIAAASTFTNTVFKWAVRRKRPHLKHVPEFRHLRRIPSSSSFPSGHSASAFAFAVGAGLELPEAAAPLGALATGVAYSRVYTGVHYPGDVIVGAAVGAGVAAAMTRLWPLEHPPPAEQLPLKSSRQQPSQDGAGLTVVVNPSAGPALSLNPARKLRDELPSAEIVEIEDGDQLEETLVRAAEGLAIGVSGGDGTVNVAARVARDARKPLLVVPGGTLNHLARDLGIDTVDDAVAAVREGRVAAIDTSEIDGRIFMNTASVGSYVELVDARERLESRIGKWPAVAVALAGVLRRSEPVNVEVDGVARKVWMLFAGNCRYNAAGFAPARRDSLDDGLLDVRLVDAQKPFARVRLVFAVMTGRLASCKVYEQWVAEEVKIRSLEGPLRMARDGETFSGSSEFVIAKSGSVEVFIK